MAEEGYKVSLSVYDLSQGLARQLSTSFLGKAIEAIWHTGVVVYGYEYYFGGGIQRDSAGETVYGNPIRVVDLGFTHVPQDVFEDYLQDISQRYTDKTYNLLSHNCNNFSNEVVQFLVGVTIPDYILNLPNEVMSSPMGSLILPMIQRLETTLKSGAVPQPPQFVTPAVVAQHSVPKLASPSSSKNSPEPAQAENRDSRNPEAKRKEKKIAAAKPAAKPAATDKDNPVCNDPLGQARAKVQEEITREFAAIMAEGTLRASEAAALATRRVMQKYGTLNAQG